MAKDLRHTKNGFFYYDSFSDNIWKVSQLFETELEAIAAKDDASLTWEVAVIRCKKCNLAVPVGCGLTSELMASCKKCNKSFKVAHKDILWVSFDRAQRAVYICSRDIIAEVSP